MDPFNNQTTATSNGIEDFSIDRLDSLNDPRSLHTSGLGDTSGLHDSEDIFSLGVLNSENQVPSPSISQFDNLNLHTSGRVSGGSGERDIEIDSGDGGDDDPFAALEAAIEEDKPKTEPSPEWKRMLDAIQTEEQEQPSSSMVPENPLPHATVAAATTNSASLDEDIDLDAPILLHPTTEETSVDVEGSPSQVLAAAQQQESATTSDNSGAHGDASGLAGTTIPPTTSILAQTLSEDPAQEMEDIRRRSFATLQPICSSLLAHRNDSAKLSKLLLELQQVLLNLQPAGVQSCVDYVIFPLQVALDAIAATRGGGGGSSSGDGGAPTTSTPSTTSAFPALKSDKTAEAALSALLILLQKGTECTSGDQLLSLLHRLCGILALPGEAVSEEIRLGTLKVVIAAVTNVPYNEALQFSVREESSAPLIGHLGSVLVKAAAAEVEAGSGTGSKRIRIEALKALKLLIQAVNDAEALSFFLPGLITGLARALLVAGGGVSRSYGSPAVSGAATVEALHGLTSLLQATLGNDSVADLLLNNEDISTARGAMEGVDADEAESQQQWGNLTGDAALEELYKLSNKKIGKISPIEEDNTKTTKNELPSPSTKTPPTITAPPQPGEALKLRVDRTQEWVRTSSTRIIEMLNTVLPPLASADAKADVREALVHTCGTLSVCCSLALSGCVSTLTDIILALAQDSWPSVATAARSWLNTSTTTKAAAVVPYELKASSPTTTFSCVPIQDTAEKSLKTWLDDLPAALRRGDEAGKAHALKITTCLEACPPQWIVNHLLSHSTEVGRLIHVFAECFAVDADSVGLLLVAVPESGGTAFTTTSATASGPSPSGSTNTGPSTVSIALPRMPLCLHRISTQKSYECIANLVRTLAAVAVTADNADESENCTSAGTALRSLIDGCLQHIHNLVDSGMGTQSGGSLAKVINRPGAGVKKNKKNSNKVESSFPAPMEIDSSPSTECSWTVSAAQIVFVLTEIIFGASSAWKPLSSLLSTAAATTPSSSSSSSAKLNTKTKELEALVALVLPELVDSRIWSLPTAITNTTATTSTAVTAAAALPSSSPGFTSKDRGSNALLQRAILDCIGTSARALNLQFTSNGRLLRFILLPVIEKMGDPCPIVASAADTTIQAICTFCGYSTSTGGGLRQLVADNADYIVDGLCRQLRQPENFPLAPQLFAALLGQGGVAPGLVPLLAEPARQALLGISIVARKKKPEHVLSFVQCLREIARGAGLVAQETCAELESYAALVEERREFLLEMIKENKIQEEISKNKIGVVEEVVEEPMPSPSLEENLKSSGKSNDKMDEINKYFKDHLAQKQKRTAGTGANVSGGGGIDGQEDMEEDDIKVPLLLEEWNQIQISRRKAASCASLAQSSADTAGPLILSSSLPVAIQSIKTCSEALEALKYASKGVEICAKQIDPVIMPPNGIIGPTPDPTTAAFLPSVHLLWSPLMGALSDWRVSVVESVLLMLSHISQLAGSFLTRRFSEEAWPIMARLLKEGPSQKRIIAPGQDDLSSPAVVHRAQRAVLACVRSMATGGPGPEAIISPVAASVLVAAADLMGEKHPAVIRENATTTFVSLSKVDPDAAWGLLVAAIRSSHSAATMASKKLEVVVVEDFVGLPTMAEICTAPPSGSEKFVPIGLKTCGETKLLALLKQVNELPVEWHQDIEKLLSI